MVELCFVDHEAPSAHEGRGLNPSKLRTSAIRSHARRATHRQARHQRMSEYRRQSPTCGNERQQEKDAIVAGTCLDGPVAIGSPSSCLDSLRRDPFQSLALPVNDVEQLLIDYYVTVFAPNPSPGCTVVIPTEIYTYQVTTQWVPFAFADRCLLNGLFLHTSRKIAALHGNPQAEYYERLALKYKITCIRLLRTIVSREATAPSDTLIAGSLFLALDEIQEQNLNEATSHVQAVERMVELRGGRAFLGLEGFLERLISLCGFHVGNNLRLKSMEYHVRKELELNSS